MCVSQKLVFRQSKCISAIKRILSTTTMYVSSYSYMSLCIACYCDACLKSSTLHVGVKTLHNTITRVWLNGNIGDIAWSEKWRHVKSFVWDQIYARISQPTNLIIFFEF